MTINLIFENIYLRSWWCSRQPQHFGGQNVFFLTLPTPLLLCHDMHAATLRHSIALSLPLALSLSFLSTHWPSGIYR